MRKVVVSLLSAMVMMFGLNTLAQDGYTFGESEVEQSNADEADGDGDGRLPDSAFVQSESPTATDTQSGDSKILVGGHLMLGPAGVAEDWADLPKDGVGGLELKARMAGGIGAFFQYFLTDMIALSAGLDFIGKGDKTHYDFLRDRTQRERVRHLEIPLGIRLNIQNIRLGFDLAFSIAVYGEYWRKENKINNLNVETDDKVIHEVHFDDSDWDNKRRFNIDPRLTAGYAIPVGKMYVIPGILFEFDLLNAAAGSTKDANVKLRYINFMFTAALAFGL